MRVSIVFGILFAIAVLIGNSPGYADSVDRRYDKAAINYHRLFKPTEYRKKEENWLKTIRQFQVIYKNHSHHQKATASLFNVGKLYRGLFRLNGKSIYLDRSSIAFRHLVEKYPTSPLSDNAQYLLAENYERFKKDLNIAYVEYRRLTQLFPNQATTKKAYKKLSQLEPNLTSVQTTPQTEDAFPPKELLKAKFGGLSRKESNSAKRFKTGFQSGLLVYP